MVKRFRCTDDGSGYEDFGAPIMEESPNGDYVRIEDYQKMEKNWFQSNKELATKDAEIKKLRDALKVYAEGDWTIEYGEDNWLVCDDFGTTARKALEGCGETSLAEKIAGFTCDDIGSLNLEQKEGRGDE